MRFSINVPNFGDFADAETVARVASAAEAAGWDGLFVWDHVVHDKRLQRSFGDPWMLLTAAALATERLRLGPVGHPGRPATAAAARAPGVDPGQPERRAGDLRRRAGRPDRGRVRQLRRAHRPEVACRAPGRGPGPAGRYWSGEPVTHEGRHFQVQDVTLLPPPVQRPRVPVWIGGFWPHRRPMRRAARWDGAVPLFLSAGHGHPPPLEEVRDLVAYVRAHRDGDPAPSIRGRAGRGRARPTPPAPATCSAR